MSGVRTKSINFDNEEQEKKEDPIITRWTKMNDKPKRGQRKRTRTNGV